MFFPFEHRNCPWLCQITTEGNTGLYRLGKKIAPLKIWSRVKHTRTNNKSYKR